MKSETRYQHITYAFIRANRLHRALCDRTAKKLSLHRSQHRILMLLAKQEKALSQKELASRMEISTVAVAKTINKLEKAGFLSKQMAENDCRFNDIAITQKGKDAVLKTRDYFSKIDDAMFSGIDEEKLRTFEECLKVMTQNLITASGEEELH